MRMLFKAQIPVAKGNEAIQSGALPRVVQTFLEQAQPESAVFTIEDGKRTMFAVFDMDKVEDMPRLGEPFFMELDAAIELTPCMNAAELAIGLRAIL
ncbi:MAG TPA: hypothetical protein VG271_06945 [Beijerinckiaceae bacterium]|jgi:hypothetical protein|nr:hypothetical protein [Beijerinckiaceae bacterium]